VPELDDPETESEPESDDDSDPDSDSRSEAEETDAPDDLWHERSSAKKL